MGPPQNLPSYHSKIQRIVKKKFLFRGVHTALQVCTGQRGSARGRVLSVHMAGTPRQEPPPNRDCRHQLPPAVGKSLVRGGKIWYHTISIHQNTQGGAAPARLSGPQEAYRI